MIGADSMYATAQLAGTPLLRRRRITATIPHSHIGNRNPRQLLHAIARARFLGRKRWKNLDGSNSSMAPDATAPTTMNGSASRMMLMNVLRKSLKLNGLKNELSTNGP